MASFERIFNLAKKTGDRLVVFDSATGDGFVAVSIDEYEQMVTNPRSVEDLTGDQLIEQINRDIGRWRESREAEEDAFDVGYTDPVRQQSFVSDMPWESAGELLRDRYNFGGGYEQEDEDEDEEDGWSDEEFDAYIAKRRFDADPFAPISERRAWNIPMDDEPAEHMDESDGEGVWEDLIAEPTVEDLPRPVPQRTDSVAETWEEEPLEGDEEPVFFEEPV
jgi:hypothetical protein